MTLEQEVTVSHNSWSEKISASNRKLLEIIEKTYSLINLDEENFQSLTRKTDYHGNQLILLTGESEELESAPEEIKMILADLGLESQDQIDIELNLGNPSNRFNKNSFTLSIIPKDITEQKLGITLSSKHRHIIHAPTRREFDGIHQTVYTRYGRGQEVARCYEDDLNRPSSIATHPYTVEILEAGVNWFVELVESRKKHDTPRQILV